MCGINGIFFFKNSNLNLEKKIKKMNAIISHRGRDNDSIFLEKNIALGHRRLSILDLSEAGNQPFFSKDKRYAIVYNGEIYNFLEIKKELKEFDFHTNTDTELVLNAFQKWGKESLQKFNGMFAFAIWDNLKKEIFIARDRIGIKPIYYFRDEEKIIFSSEIRGILSTELVPRKLNKKILNDYLIYQTIHAPETFVKNIFVLKASHFIFASDKKFLIQNYWDILKNYNRKINASYEDTKNKVRLNLTKSVERRMISDVDFGAFLSGGIDSSIIVALMSSISNKKINTFNVSFDEKKFSESHYAKIIGKKFNTNHTEIKLKEKDFLELLPSALESMDFPTGDGLNTYVVSKFTKAKGISVALSGLGGDELFAGYPIFRQILNLEKYKYLKKMPFFIKNFFSNILKLVKPSISSEKISEILLLENWNFENIYPISRKIFSDAKSHKILNDNNLEENFIRNFLLKNNKFSILPKLSQISFAEINTYLQNILLRDSDQMGMAHTLEIRVPFLDHKLIEYVFGISDDFKFPHTPKKLLTDSFENLIPKEIINRQKMGFVLPYEKWLKNEIFDFANSKIINLSKQGFFNEKSIKNLWKSFLKNDKRVSWSRVWHLIVFQNILEKNKIS